MDLRNQVQLIGHLGQDVETRTFESGKLLATASLATNSHYRNREGERVESTEWHAIVAWGKTAELLAEYAKKGSLLIVHGKLTYGNYEDETEVNRTICRILVREFSTLKN